MLPIAGLAGAVDWSSFWQGLATVLGSAAVYAQRKAAPERDAVEELCLRLRHPYRHAARHPIISLRRKLDRRR